MENITGIECCDWCGKGYDSNSEGHEHFEDGGCECDYCLTHEEIKGKKFCSPECECNYINKNLK